MHQSQKYDLITYILLPFHYLAQTSFFFLELIARHTLTSI